MKKSEPRMIKAYSFQEVMGDLKQKAKNPPPPLSIEQQAEVDGLLKKLSAGGGFMACRVK